MLKEKLKGLIELTRIEHAFMLSVAVIIGYALSNSLILDLNHIVGLLIPFFIEMGAFALNDVVDFKTDLVNNRFDRPLVRGIITKKEGIFVTIISFLIALLLSFFLDLYVKIIALSFALLSIAYNIKLKDLPLLGNSFIALSMAIPFIFGALIGGHVTKEIIYITLTAFFLGMAREIVKSVEDMVGDLKVRKSKTLPILIGKKNALIVALFFVLLFIPFSLLAFFSLPFKFWGFLLFIIAYLLLGKSLFLLNKPRESRNFMLYALIFGLIAYLFQIFLPF